MLRELTVKAESWPLAVPFRISRGARVAADVIVVEIREGSVVGRGESVPYARYRETPDLVSTQVRRIAKEIERGLPREEIARLLPPGAARNAVECAMWDLSARLNGESVASQLGSGPLPALTTAVTVSLDTPERMGEAAARLAAAKVIKVKVDAHRPDECLRAVRAAAPASQLIVDANEGWTPAILQQMQPVLEATSVALLEQPLPAGQDDALAGFESVCPVCADESCHVAADLAKLEGRYQAVNIKLDKTGGLAAAFELLEAARAAGMQVMVGCMVCTSLGIAPAFHVARHADFVDLDGPLWLGQDRDGGVRQVDGQLLPPAADLWGGGDLRAAPANHEISGTSE